MNDHPEIREAVRRRYAAAASRLAAHQDDGAHAVEASCCGTAPVVSTTDAQGRQVFGAELYRFATGGEGVPESAAAASLGCGVPTAVADLHPGEGPTQNYLDPPGVVDLPGSPQDRSSSSAPAPETVLDLGSGAGADVLIAARRVAPGGRVIGLDMTVEMLELAQRNATETGVTNVEFLEGYLEDIPLPDASVDVVISNCVINLAADKHIVLREAARVLRPGGRLAVSDVLADTDMDDTTRTDMAQWTGCVAGALTEDEYRVALVAAGLSDIEITETHRVHAKAAAALIRARRPAER